MVNESSGIKRRHFCENVVCWRQHKTGAPRVTERLAASQEEFCSVELFIIRLANERYLGC
jgi:hypothetical protein